MQLNFCNSFCASEREVCSVPAAYGHTIAFSAQRDKAAICLRLTSLRNVSVFCEYH